MQMQMQNIETVSQKRLSGTALTTPLGEDDYCTSLYFEEWPWPLKHGRYNSLTRLSEEKTSGK